jgi:cation diffusion facilitator CzcD-associated flavoprotein CzcO
LGKDMQTQILIVGAGPVGLTLALDLGRRGVRCVLVEQKAEPQFLPKMERCNARTMEMYRRIGIAEPIRAAGLSADSPMDVFIIRSMIEAPILHTSGVFHTPAMLLTMLTVGCDRILFAVDYPFEIPAEAAAWFDNCEINETDRHKIGRDNARRLFGLP